MDTLSAKTALTSNNRFLTKFSFLKQKQLCTICRTPILTSSHYLPVNVVLQNLIEKKYPHLYQQRKEAKLKEQEEVKKQFFTVDNLPILEGNPLHLFPGMNAIFTVTGRQAMDLVHHVSRGNRRFALIKAP